MKQKTPKLELNLYQKNNLDLGTQEQINTMLYIVLIPKPMPFVLKHLFPSTYISIYKNESVHFKLFLRGNMSDNEQSQAGELYMGARNKCSSQSEYTPKTSTEKYFLAQTLY